MKRSFLHALTVCLTLATLFALIVLRSSGHRIDWLTARFGQAASQASAPATALPNLQGAAATEHLKQQGLYTSLGTAMAAARYGVYEAPPKGQSSYRYYANNPAQQMQARFTPTGMSLHATAAAQKSWRLGLKLQSVGYDARQYALTPGTLTAQGNRIEYTRQLAMSATTERRSHRYGTGSGSDLVTPLLYAVEDQVATTPRTAASAIKEWYINQAAGLEQGFTLAQPVGTRRAGERLRLVMQVEGEWQMRAVEEGRAVELRNKQGGETLRYDKLVVQDAMGRELQARMQTRGCELWLEVEEAGATYPVTIDPTFTQVKKLVASDGGPNDRFGYYVAISSDTAIVGAAFDDSGQGSAYIFARNEGGTDNWGQVKKITASDGTAGDNFGNTVTIDGDTVAVGADGDDAGRGAAYVFMRNQGGANNWGQVTKISASDEQANNRFSAVSLSGNTLIVGANGDASARGSAYFFERNQGGTNNWGEVKKVTGSDSSAGDEFGKVAISGDVAVVGAPSDDSARGSAYIFARNQGGSNNWGQVKKITASDGAAGDNFGGNVAISGDVVIVGAFFDDIGGNSDQGSAYIFARNQGGIDNWGQVKKLTA